jgi:hypothetical protein
MHNLNEIRQIIRNSTVGEKLSKIERWSRFRTNELREDWLALLGPTAVVLTHQEHFVDFVMNWSNSLDFEMLEMLLLAGSIHDIGEASVGDIANPDKTPEGEADEFIQAIVLLKQLGFEYQIEMKLGEAYQQVVVGENQTLHFIFMALERTEYLDTAIHLFNALKKGQAMEKGYYMIARILAFDLPKILEYAAQLPNIVGDYLKEFSATIDIMFSESETAADEGFIDAFREAKLKWSEYSSNFK